MDIFAAQLKRITTVPIRRQRVKINALNKGSASKELTDDLDHLENHEQYFESPEDTSKEDSSKAYAKYPHEQASDGEELSTVHMSDNETSLEKNTVEEQTHEKEKIEEKEYIDAQVIPDFLAYAKKPRVRRDELKQLEDAKKSLKHFDIYI